MSYMSYEAFGTRAVKNQPVNNCTFPKLYFRSDDGSNRAFNMNMEMLDKHLLCLGGPGSGKTNVIDLILSQLRNSSTARNEVFVIFDTKGDYLNHFGRPGDYVISNENLNPTNGASMVFWNVFEEIRALTQKSGISVETAAREISRILFADRKNSTQPFFSNAAEDLFMALLVHFWNQYKAMGTDILHNKILVDAVKTKDVKWYLDDVLNEKKNPQFVGMRSYLGDGSSNQALGVLAELKSMVYGCFTDNFSMAKGSFSICDAVRKRGGRAIFIEYDITVGENLTPMYRLLVDIALKETLGRGNAEKNRVWFILDELKLLPHSKHLEDGLNLGRGLGCSIIAGLQSVNQMYNIYGKEGGQVIVGGFSNIFAFSVSDHESREYISELFGRNLIHYWYEGNSPYSGADTPREREGYTVEDWELKELRKGDCFVGLVGHDPFKFHFPKFIK